MPPAAQPPQRSERGRSGLGPHVVGQRVVVRRVVRGETGPSGGPAMTDVLGTCEWWADGRAGVRTAAGELVEFATADVVSGKPVPPRPPIHRNLSATEADRRVVPEGALLETARLGAWWLRASGGCSLPASSALALGDPGVPLPEAVQQVGAWYAARALPPRAHVDPGSETAQAFGAQGWQVTVEESLMLGSVARVSRSLRLLPGPGCDLELTEAAPNPTTRAEIAFVVARADARVRARGRGVLHDDWLGLGSLWTDAGPGSDGPRLAVVGSLLEQGAEQGATTVYLQVNSNDPDAMREAEDLGFTEHDRYAYVEPPRRS